MKAFMKVFKELFTYIIGLFFILLGILTFTYIEYVNQRPNIGDTILYYVIAVGFIFIILGSIFMIFFVKKDTKKKSSK
jgi:hypothetical protein